MSNEKKVETFKFMVNNKPFESGQAHVTGAQIKVLAGVEAAYGLFYEGRGKDPDRQVRDDEIIDLGEPGREQFYTMPPATYGRGGLV